MNPFQGTVLGKEQMLFIGMIFGVTIGLLLGVMVTMIFVLLFWDLVKELIDGPKWLTEPPAKKEPEKPAVAKKEE